MQFTTELVNFYQTPQDKRFIYAESTRSNWYMILPLRGSFWYKLQNFEKGHVSFGSFVLCPPDWTFYRSNEVPLPFISIEFKWFDEHGVPYTTANQNMYGKITIHDIPRLTSTLHKFTEIKATLLTEATFYRNHLLSDLLLSCSLEQRQQRMKRIEDHVVLHAIRHLEDNFEQPISLKALADHSFLSQSQFCRRFQAATGLSPIQYLTEIRLQKACFLLLETDYTIERIALECGYHNGFYFSRVFRKKYELSPSTYREQNSV